MISRRKILVLLIPVILVILLVVSSYFNSKTDDKVSFQNIDTISKNEPPQENITVPPKKEVTIKPFSEIDNNTDENIIKCEVEKQHQLTSSQNKIDYIKHDLAAIESVYMQRHPPGQENLAKKQASESEGYKTLSTQLSLEESKYIYIENSAC